MVAGFGLTYLIGIPLLIEERIAFGSVLGAMAVAGLGFLFALVIRDVTALTVLVSLGIVLVVALVAAARNRNAAPAP